MSGIYEVPVIETERLRLRGRTLDDFPFIRDMWGDPEVVRHISGAPVPEETSWTKFLRMFGHWRPKPDVRMFRRLLARLRVPASSVTLVEDTLEHQKAARSLGMRTV